MEALATTEREPCQVANTDGPMSLEAVTEQVDYIQQVMKKVMREDEHYGVIPGTEKPTLLKSGAEKLNLAFRMNPEYEIVNSIERDNFILKEIKCILIHIPTGDRLATGIGSCNSREKKYLYENVATDEPVPQEYWAARTKGDHDKMREIMGADGAPKKQNGQWFIARRMENPNPWDKHNTIVKMACKRALVAAVLNATGASDIFTQDLEDTVEEKPAKKSTKKAPENVDPDTGEITDKYLEWPADKVEMINGGFDILGYSEDKRVEIIKCFDDPDRLLDELNARVDSLK